MTAAEDAERDGTRHEQFRTWRLARPFWGGVLLVLTGVLFGAITLHVDRSLAGGQPPAVLAPGVAAGAVLVGCGVVVQRLPGTATILGVGGVLATIGGVTGLFFTAFVYSRKLWLLLALCLGLLGSTLTFGWRDDRQTNRLRRDARNRLITTAATGTTVVVALVVLTGSGMGATFPAQQDAYGGFVVEQETLEAGYYDYDPDCGTLGAECPNLSVDTNKHERLTPIARQRLKDVRLTGFQISKNFQLDNPVQRDNETIETVSMRMSAETAQASGDKAIDTYISEFYSDRLIPEVAGIPADNISYWSCSPHNDSGFGTINDDRLGLSMDPSLSDGRNVVLLSHQLASSETTLRNFELVITERPHDRLPVRKDEPDECA